MSRHIMSRHIMSRHIMSRHVTLSLSKRAVALSLSKRTRRDVLRQAQDGPLRAALRQAQGDTRAVWVV
jgi:hypothetical protein